MFGPPDQVAGTADVLGPDDQAEVLGHAAGGVELETGAAGRQVAHDALDAGVAIERNRPALECPVSLVAAPFEHDSSVAPACKKTMKS
jgi:hypothetical protein